MPRRHRSAWRRRQDSQARRRMAVIIGIPMALAVAVGAIVAVSHGFTSQARNAALTNCASPTASAASGSAAPTTAGSATATTAPTTAASGSAKPTTAASGSAAPTTAASGSAAPTTAAPGSAAPTTAASGSAKPTTVASGSAAPTTAASASAKPTTAASGSASPTPCPSGSATASTPAAAANVSCNIVVPANPLSATGLSTPYQLTGSNGMTAQQSGCTMANFAALGAFVQATILNPATGALSTYEPLVITQGTQPAAKPVVPTLPAGAVVTVDFGFNGTNLTLAGTGNSLRQGNCVNGLNGSIFGQVAFCNGTQFFQAVNQAEARGVLKVPAVGHLSQDWQPVPDHPVVRDDRPGPERQRDLHVPAQRQRPDRPGQRGQRGGRRGRPEDQQRQ